MPAEDYSELSPFHYGESSLYVMAKKLAPCFKPRNMTSLQASDVMFARSKSQTQSLLDRTLGSKQVGWRE